MNNKTALEAAAEQVKARSLAHLIDDLVRISNEAKTNEDCMNPLLSLYLNSGQIIQGWVTDRSPDGSTLLLRMYTDPSNHPASAADDICFLPVSQIISIAILAGHRSLT
ncbi:MAG: hypothetical protein H6626_00830 [Pseudobdellovibrionaceae bacterium]|nr:hypothetical protein [Bdellovibrionales bacterium]USN47668.1 MAG: hypothetical protein H6626_00830 [Pseudobdellovibrionaceae bacterium]